MVATVGGKSVEAIAGRQKRRCPVIRSSVRMFEGSLVPLERRIRSWLMPGDIVCGYCRVEIVAARGREKVHLEFDAYDAGASLHQGERRIAARAAHSRGPAGSRP
jgi:hypothetical protein